MEDLRHRMYQGIILFVVVFFGGFFSAGVILKETLSFIHLDQVTITTHSPFEFVDVSMDIGFFLATMVFAPYMIYSFYAFIAPALTRREKIKLFKSIPLAIALFAIGFIYGFFILYYALELLALVNVSLGIANFWNISQFLSEIFITSALLGIVFELPLLLTLIIRLGIIKTQLLKDKRRIAYFLIFVLVSLLPPTDGISLIAMAVPLALLYEVTIWFNSNINKNNNNQKICLD